MPGGAAEVRKATLTVNMTPRARTFGGQQAADRRRTACRGWRRCRGRGSRLASLLPTRSNVIVLAGEDGELLASHARQVERELRGIPGIGSVTTTASLTRPELVIRPDFARMADLGVTSAAIADTLRIATAGDYDQGLAKLNLPAAPGADRRQAAAGRPRRPRPAAPCSPSPVATARSCWAMSPASGSLAGRPRSPATDRLRNINFEVELNGQRSATSRRRRWRCPSLQQLPPGIIQTTIGDAEAMGELFASFGLAMATGVLCIYIVLVLLFKDFVQPVTILAGARAVGAGRASWRCSSPRRRCRCRR